MSYSVLALQSIAQLRRDQRELDYLWGDPVVPEGLSFHPLFIDPPCTGSSIYDGVGGVGDVISRQPMWDDRIRYGGWSNFPYRITGIVIDSGGTPVSNAVCSLFRTSDDQWMYDAVSQSGGQYDFGVSDTTTTYYIVAYRAGPDIEGTTVNTLTGS